MQQPYPPPYLPDLNYAPILDGNSLFGASNGSEFRLMDDVNFAASSSSSSWPVPSSLGVFQVLRLPDF